MARPHFGPPRLKPRPYRDGHSSDSNEGSYNPSSRGRRDAHSYPVKAPFNLRESRGRGRHPVGRRAHLVKGQREPRFNNWSSPNQDSFHTYTPKMEPHHNQRRPSPSRLNRSPHVQHHSSSRSAARGSQSQRGSPFHGHRSGHRPESPRHFRSHPADRRPGSTQPPHGSFRGHKRQPGFVHPDQRNRDSRGSYNPRGRLHDRSGHGMKRWNEAGGFPHQFNGEHRPSGSQRNPREMHGRGLMPERWSSEQHSRRQRGPGERQGSRSHSRERAQDVSHLPPFRTPSWKGSSQSSYHRSPQERQATGSRKRNISNISMSSSDPALESGNPKRPWRERPQLLNVASPFGGKPLALRDKSFLVKSKQIGAQSLMKLKLPPYVKPRLCLGDSASQGSVSSVLAFRKRRFQTNAVPLKKLEPRATSQPSSSNDSSSSSRSSRDSDTSKEQVESRRSLSKRRASPIEKRDLVVLSHWDSSSKDVSPLKSGSPRSKTDEEERAGSRFLKTSEPRFEERKRSYLDKRVFRPFNTMQDNQRNERPFRRPGPSPMQKHKYSGLRRPGPELSVNIRRPLMETLVSRPFPNQRPVFKKSQSIVYKYRNMRVVRQHPPYNRRSNQQHW